MKNNRLLNERKFLFSRLLLINCNINENTCEKEKIKAVNGTLQRNLFNNHGVLLS